VQCPKIGYVLALIIQRKYNKLIDYVKISLKHIDINRLENSLDFLTEVSEKTGELSSKKIAEYHFCKIVIYDSGVVLFTGSIHKLWNSLCKIKAPNHKKVKQYRGFNGNLFTINNILKVRNHLSNLFNCPPEQMVFQNIEFGVNTTLLFNPQQYLKGLLYHKNILFEYKFRRNFAQAPHQRYILKIYNKSSQYGMNKNVLRIELKITKIKELNEIGLKTFADVNGTILDKAKQMLLRRFDEVMHYDYSIDKNKLPARYKRLIRAYSNPRFWIDEIKPRYRDRHKKRLNEITRNHSQNIAFQLRQNIIQKCVIINRSTQPSKCVTINSSSIGLIITQNTSSITNNKRELNRVTLISII